MGDLISRSALLQEFETENVAHNNDLWHITGIKAFIENAPTAYSVDKVVAELKNTKRFALAEVKMLFLILCKSDLQEFVDMCFDEAIDIVKRGGAE